MNPFWGPEADEDDADARAVDRAYANAPEEPGPVHRIPAIDAVRAELAAAVRERDEARAALDKANRDHFDSLMRVRADNRDRVREVQRDFDEAIAQRDAAQHALAELRAGALLAIDAKRHGSQLDYENFVGLLLNALAGGAAVGMPGEGVAVRGEGANDMACDDVALRVVGGGR